MTAATIADSLGGMSVLGTEIDSTLEWVEALADGFPTASVNAAIESGILTQNEVDEFVIPRRTLSHRRQRSERLSLEESDRLGRIARVTARAAETFGDRSEAVAWLRESNGALGGSRPLDMLRSGEGAILVEQVLIRIDHGVHT